MEQVKDLQGVLVIRMKTVEIDVATLKSIVVHLIRCNSYLTVNYKDMVKKELNERSIQYDSWKSLGLESDWHKSIEYLKKILRDIDYERQFEIETVKLMHDFNISLNGGLNV